MRNVCTTPMKEPQAEGMRARHSRCVPRTAPGQAGLRHRLELQELKPQGQWELGQTASCV